MIGGLLEGVRSQESGVRITAPVLVLSVGNLLLGDDGVGLRLLERLEAAGNEGVEFVDGGTQGLALLGCLEDREAVLVLDAVGLGAEPGTVHLLKGEEVERLRARRASTAHEGNALELLETARMLGLGGKDLAVVGIEPASVRTGIGLSTPVERSMGEALACAREILKEMIETHVSGNSR